MEKRIDTFVAVSVFDRVERMEIFSEEESHSFLKHVWLHLVDYMGKLKLFYNLVNAQGINVTPVIFYLIIYLLYYKLFGEIRIY